ncbi:MAG: copper amine oxidase N-terminal domain-containing protein, partial [Syntrophomonadaceae bacterium]|nr:copper amine oxidase N-terminal domain-containing protein [Syntrophomonadaceae bacterium]
MRKTNWIIGLILLAIVCCWTPNATAAPTVNLDGRQLAFEVPPMIENGRTLVPLRAIFEEMGATVTWDPATYSATAVKSDTIVVLHVGSTTPTINGEVTQLDVPAKIVNGRTLAPLRFVGETFGGTV